MNKDQSKTQYRFPPVPDWVPLRKTKNSSLRMAVIVGDRLYQGLKFEGELLLLTKTRWEQVLKYGHPDFLLVELPCIKCRFSDSNKPGFMNENQDFLTRAVQKSREFQIPSVLWITQDIQGMQNTLQLAKLCDLTCCANQSIHDVVSIHSKNTMILQPCVQPAIYNPFFHFEDQKSKDFVVALGSSTSHSNDKSLTRVAANLKSLGVECIFTAIHSKKKFKSNTVQKKELHHYISSGAFRRINAYVRNLINDDRDINGKWETLEAAACRIPVILKGVLEDSDFRKDFTTACSTEDEVLDEIFRYLKDDLYRERIGHRAWRAVNESHTFSHRLKKICEILGLTHDWREFPKASLIMPTYREHLLPECVDKYLKIEWENKELVLVFNGDKGIDYEDLGLNSPREDIKILNLPSDLFAGAALNLGHQLARGFYYFRIDDDDYYAENYIKDMILFARSIDADFFGKPPVPIQIKDESPIYKKDSSNALSLVSVASLIDAGVWLGGNSIAGTSAFFFKYQYLDHSYGAADTALVLSLPRTEDARCAFMDEFNLVAVRRPEIKSHTWQIDHNKIILERIKLIDFKEVTC